MNQISHGKLPDTRFSNIFYSKLHPFLKIWANSYTKTAIGKLYTRIDPFLKQRKYIPDNAYRFVERMVNRFIPKIERFDEQKSDVTSVYHDLLDVNISPLDSFEPPHFDSWPRSGDHESVSSTHTTECWQDYDEECGDHESVSSTYTTECWQDYDEECGDHESVSSTYTTECQEDCGEECSDQELPCTYPTEQSKKKTVCYKPRYVKRREKRKQARIDSLREKIRERTVKVKKLEGLVKEKDTAVSQLQDRLDPITTELNEAVRTINKTVFERDHAKKKVHITQMAYNSMLSDFIASEDFIATMQTDFEDDDSLEEFEDDKNQKQSRRKLFFKLNVADTTHRQLGGFIIRCDQNKCLHRQSQT